VTVVVGVDLSMQATGICTPDGVQVLKSSGRDGAPLAVRRARLVDISGRVSLAVAEAVGLPPAGVSGALVVIEAPSLGQSRQRGTHDRSGLWWLVVDELMQAGHRVVEVPPASVKKYATGSGSANKGAMADAAARRIPHVHTAGEDNAVDALWLRAMGCDQLGSPLATVPQAHRDALTKVAWPSTLPAAPGRTAS
jgi:crossover junction endodeoxyribonuclease RuvC